MRKLRMESPKSIVCVESFCIFARTFTKKMKMNHPLEYTLTNDLLFKMLFRNYPALLKRVVAMMLRIAPDSIDSMVVTNPEIPPDALHEKSCRLDIAMKVDGRLVNLEVQVANEGNYSERSLFHWARLYSSGLKAGNNYSELPPTITINIIAFNLFESDGFYSEFRPLEVTRHTLLTDRQCICYFELGKLPKPAEGDDELKLWMALFNAKTEEELTKLKNIGGDIMTQAVNAYHHVAASGEFRELERLREKARHDEAQALANARRIEREKWQVVLAEKDTALAEKDTALAEKDTALAEKDTALAENAAALAEKDAALAEKDALIATLTAQIEKK
jgi:predicted transposase/invertase (TIGR01784 family)